MPNLTTYGLALIPLVIAGLLIVLYLRKTGKQGEAQPEKKTVGYQGVVKRDWVVTGRIDFATHEGSGGDDADRPAEFKLLVEERRIVQSIAGNENLEIQWRLASLREAKVVIANYHKYLGEHGLIKPLGGDELPAAPGLQAEAPEAPAKTPEPVVRMVASGGE